MNVRLRGGLIALGVTVLAAGAVAGLTFAGAVRAATAPPCAIAVSTVVAGRPLELSGPWPASSGLVEIVARNELGYVREGDWRQVGDSWNGTITFRITDAGSWTIRISDGVTVCESPLAVTLPPGSTAPPVEAGLVDDSLVPPPPLIDAGTIRSSAAIAAAAIFSISIVYLLGVALAAASGHRPFGRKQVRRLAQGAAFIAVLGASVVFGLVIVVAVSLRHFFSTAPPEEEAVLELVVWAVTISGAVLGVRAAQRVPRGSSPAADTD